MLSQLIYCSAARTMLTPAELTRLLGVSRMNNSRENITGMLLYSEGSFFQVLEGDEEKVERLFSLIEKASRHHALTIIAREPIAERSFGDWTMGCADLLPEQVDDIIGTNDFLAGGHSFAALGESRVKKLLNAFKSGRWRGRITGSALSEKTTGTSAGGDGMPPDFAPAWADRPQGDGRFSYAFQPIIDSTSKRVFSYEALIRGPGNESARQVLESVEASESIDFQTRSQIYAIHLAAHLGLSTRLNLNFLPSAALSSSTAIPSIIEAAERHHVCSEQIVLEILEGELVEDYEGLAKALRSYRTSGLRFAIDDFGQGYAGLNLLAAFQPHWIKLDLQLVRGVDRRGPNQAIIRGIVRTCLDLGIDVIAEGIETLDEYEWLRGEGIFLFQGYFFSKPSFEKLSRDFVLPGS